MFPIKLSAQLLAKRCSPTFIFSFFPLVINVFFQHNIFYSSFFSFFWHCFFICYFFHFLVHPYFHLFILFITSFFLFSLLSTSTSFSIHLFYHSSPFVLPLCLLFLLHLHYTSLCHLAVFTLVVMQPSCIIYAHFPHPFLPFSLPTRLLLP